MARAMPWRWPKPEPGPSPGARSSSCRRRRLPASAPLNGSTKPPTSGASSYLARIVVTDSGCASSNCAGSVARTVRSLKLLPTSASPARCRFLSTTRHGCWSTANGARCPKGTTARRGFTCRRCTARLAGGRGATSPWPGSVPSARSPDHQPRSRPSRTPNSGRPGSRKVKRPTGSACWNGARTIALVPCRLADCC